MKRLNAVLGLNVTPGGLLLLMMILSFGTMGTCLAEDNAQRLGVFLFVPPDMHVKSKTDDGSKVEYFPVCQNRISKCLPGKLYDVRGWLEQQGVKFGLKDFAWFNPEQNVLVVNTSPADLEFVEALVTGVYCPSVNIILEGKISVGGKPATKEKPSSNQFQWRITSSSGQRATISLSGDEGYSMELEPIVGPDGETIECNMVLKVSHGGKEYTTSTKAVIFTGKLHTLLLGTTPSGEKVEFHLTPTVHKAIPPSILNKSKREEDLLKCIKESLAE